MRVMRERGGSGSRRGIKNRLVVLFPFLALGYDTPF